MLGICGITFFSSQSLIFSEHLDPVIAEVHDDDVALGADADAAGPVELARTGPLGPERADEHAARAEDLPKQIQEIMLTYKT